MIDILDDMLRLVDELEQQATIFLDKMKQHQQPENQSHHG